MGARITVVRCAAAPPRRPVCAPGAAGRWSRIGPGLGHDHTTGVLDQQPPKINHAAYAPKNAQLPLPGFGDEPISPWQHTQATTPHPRENWFWFLTKPNPAGECSASTEEIRPASKGRTAEGIKICWFGLPSSKRRRTENRKLDKRAPITPWKSRFKQSGSICGILEHSPLIIIILEGCPQPPEVSRNLKSRHAKVLGLQIPRESQSDHCQGIRACALGSLRQKTPANFRRSAACNYESFSGHCMAPQIWSYSTVNSELRFPPDLAARADVDLAHPKRVLYAHDTQVWRYRASV